MLRRVPGPFCLVVCVAFGIFREPSFQDPFLLQEHFVNAPEAGEGEASDDRGNDLVLYDERAGDTEQADYQPDPPGLFSPVIFHFDDSRMADADA